MKTEKHLTILSNTNTDPYRPIRVEVHNVGKHSSFYRVGLPLFILMTGSLFGVVALGLSGKLGHHVQHFLRQMKGDRGLSAMKITALAVGAVLAPIFLIWFGVDRSKRYRVSLEMVPDKNNEAYLVIHKYKKIQKVLHVHFETENYGAGIAARFSNSEQDFEKLMKRALPRGQGGLHYLTNLEGTRYVDANKLEHKVIYLVDQHVSYSRMD